MNPLFLPYNRIRVLNYANISSNFQMPLSDINSNELFSAITTTSNVLITLATATEPLIRFFTNKGTFDIFLLNGSNPIKPNTSACLTFDGSVWNIGNISLNTNQTVFEDSTTTNLNLIDDTQTAGTFNYVNASINLTNYPEGLVTPYTFKDLSLKITISDNRKEVEVKTKLYNFYRVATKISGLWSWGDWKNSITNVSSISTNDTAFMSLFGDNPIIYDDVFVARTNNVIQTLGTPTTDFTTYINSFWNLKKIALYGSNEQADGNGVLLNMPAGYDTAWVRCLGERWNSFKAYTIPTTITNNNVINLQNSNSYINCPLSTTAIGGSGITLEATFDFRGTQPGAWARFFDFGNGQSSDNIILGSDGGGNIRYQTYNNTTSGTLIVSNAVIQPSSDLLYHISVSITALGYGKIYVNGWLVGEGQSASLRNVTRSNNWIGRSNWADPYLNAHVTNIRIWNKTLSDVEIKNYYNTNPIGTESGLVCYLPKGTNSNTNIGSNGGTFTLLGTATFITTNNADMIGGVNLGHFGSGYRRVANYTPWSGSRKFHQDYHEWIPIPVGSAQKLALISKKFTDQNFWISGIAFSKNNINLASRHGVLLHWGLDMEKMGRYPNSGGNSNGSNIHWNATQPWNGDNLIELRNNAYQYALMPVVANGKDKALYIVAHNGGWDEIFPDTINVDGTEISATWEPRPTPLFHWYNRRLYNKVVCTKIPASLIGNKRLLPIRFNMTNTNVYLYAREIGTHDWI